MHKQKFGIGSLPKSWQIEVYEPLGIRLLTPLDQISLILGPRPPVANELKFWHPGCISQAQ